MNPLAQELNNDIIENNKKVYDMLSELGKKLFFPKGILSQSAEAKQYAKKFNATIGIAKQDDKAMYLPSLLNYVKNLDVDEFLPYAPSPGRPDLRKIWHENLYKKNIDLSPDTKISLPIVTSGITQGLSLIADLFIDENDTILMADKIWGNYRLTFVVRKKAKLEHFRLFSDKQGFDLIAFEEKIVELKSKMNKLVVLLNFPNNPTGYAPTKEEANSISEILLKHCSDEFKIVAVIDDAYFGLFYEEDVFKSSVFSLIAGKNENLMAIKLDAATKEDYVWGFRTGFITYAVKTSGNIEKIYNALEKKTGGAIRGNISNCPNISQAIMCKVLSSDTYQQEKEEKVGVLKARANKVKEILLNKKFDEVWDMYPFNSGYFMCVKLKNIDAEEFRKYLLKEYGIGVIAPNSTDIRVAFSSVDLKDIPELFEDMYEAALKYKG